MGWKPSIGASFHAPPMAETHPAALPSAATAGAGSEAASPQEAVQAASSPAVAATAAPAYQRRARPWTTRPKTANCMGIAYFDWSSSRRKVL